MKRMTLTLVLVAVAGMALLLSGCGESSMSDQDRQIKLLKNDKLELNKDIQNLNREIDRQKSLVKDCRKQSAKTQDDNANSLQKLLMIVVESEAKVKELTAENAALKKQLKDAGN